MVRSLACSGLLIVCSCAASAQVGSFEASAQRAWVALRSEQTTRHANLNVSFAPEHIFPAVVTFECAVNAPEAFDQTHLLLTIHDPAGTPIHTGEIRLDLSKGPASARFTWQPAGLADGTYTAEFNLQRSTGGELSKASVSIEILTGTNIHSRVDHVQEEAAALRRDLDAIASAGVHPAYATLHTAIVEDYIPFARSALAEGDWQKADQFAAYLAELSTTARLELSLVTPGTASTVMSPTVPAGRIEIQNGSLVSRGIPTYLFGAAYKDASNDTLVLLERYGLRLAIYQVTPSDTLASENATTGFAAPMASYLDDARRRGVHLVLDLATENLPPWAASPVADVPDSSSLNYDLMDDKSREILARHIRAAVSAAKGHPNVIGVSLARDPALRLRESTLREGFITLARARYREHHTMNSRWRTRYMDFDEIEVDWASRHTAYLYDLQTYHQELATQLFSSLAATSREAAPEIPVQIQFADKAFEEGESTFGIDRESILASMDMSGCSPIQPLGGNGLALGAPNQAACYALLRTLRPSAPVLNTNDGFTLPAGVTGFAAYGRVRAMMWEAAIAGLVASAIRLGTPGQGSDGILARPELIDAYATANLDINRLAPIVTALQQAPAPVRILWSMSSKMFNQGDPYVKSAMRAYQGCANFGPHTLFISERECERNGLDGVKVLVIPKALALSDDAFRAIDRYIQAGGVTIRQGNPFPYDQQGISRKEALSVSTHTILMRSEDTARAYLDAVDAAYNLDGMESPPRPVNDFDYPIDGVKSRFAVHERVPYLYLVNLREGPVRINLASPYTSGTDLVSGNHIDFPDVIDPLSPMIIQLDGPATPAKIASNTNAEGVPTVDLKPVADESESNKSESKSTLRHGR